MRENGDKSVKKKRKKDLKQHRLKNRKGGAETRERSRRYSSRERGETRSQGTRCSMLGKRKDRPEVYDV